MTIGLVEVPPRSTEAASPAERNRVTEPRLLEIEEECS
jgi:hypothetical protein